MLHPLKPLQMDDNTEGCLNSWQSHIAALTSRPVPAASPAGGCRDPWDPQPGSSKPKPLASPQQPTSYTQPPAFNPVVSLTLKRSVFCRNEKEQEVPKHQLPILDPDKWRQLWHAQWLLTFRTDKKHRVSELYPVNPDKIKGLRVGLEPNSNFGS